MTKDLETRVKELLALDPERFVNESPPVKVIYRLHDFQRVLRETWETVLMLREVPDPWQPMETAPRAGRLVLVAIEGYKRAQLARVESDGKWYTFACYPNPEGKLVTHWMPLPLPPAPRP